MAIVLLIEDDQQNADMTIRILQSANHQVIHSLRGFEGARLARRQRPDVALVDFDLPDVDGRALIPILKSQLGPHGPPIIAVTARTGVVEMRMAEQIGCDGFVSKPFMPDDLLQVVEEVLKRYV